MDHLGFNDDDQSYYNEKNTQRHNALRGTVNGLLLIAAMILMGYVFYIAYVTMTK